MSVKTTLYKRIMASYDEINFASAEELRQKKEAVYNKQPRLREIENQLSNLGVEVAKRVLFNPETVVAELEILKENQQNLQTERDMLLKELGLPSNYLEIKYKCQLCKDTGYVDSKKCRCFSRKIIEYVYNTSNLKEVVKKENFDMFNIQYYSTQVAEGEKRSPRENIQAILNSCLKFVNNFNTNCESLLFYGKPGLGKTFLCNCIAKEIIEKGATVIYITAPQLFKTLEKERFNRQEGEEVSTYLEDILDVDLLIIDDVGTEFQTSFTNTQLFDIVNTRLINRKPIIISTNHNLGDLREKYTDRIVSRIMGGYVTLRFFGEDIRLLKKIDRQ
ncbi:MAG: ATP-binding protein [Anaerotignaceae bacterium]